ncbi:hypothetical protein [Flavobacterium sp. JP2137]|uniref:hypothetical protein n=1 Tax=Flavobacterium sp. JP2137 TaxID=3414510 RepID=UPI003D3007E9
MDFTQLVDRKRLVVLVLVSLFFSCNTSVDEKAIINFDIGFNPSHLNRGVLYNELAQRYEIYFVKPLHGHRIKYYDENGDFLDSVVLKYSDENSFLNNLKVIDRDTILITEGKSNVLDFLNKKGLIFSSLNLNIPLEATYKDEYFFIPFHNNSIGNFDLNNLIVPVYYLGNADLRNKIKNSGTDFDLFYKAQKDAYVLGRFNSLFHSNPIVSMGFKKFFVKIPDSINVLASDYNFVKGLDKNIFFSNYHNNLFSFDDDLNHIGVIELASQVAKEGFVSCINDVLYDRRTQKYSVIVYDYYDKVVWDQEPYEFRIRTYDKDFNFFGEELFKSDEYDSRTVLLLNDRLFVEVKNNSYGKVFYRVFKAG